MFADEENPTKKDYEYYVSQAFQHLPCAKMLTIHLADQMARPEPLSRNLGILGYTKELERHPSRGELLPKGHLAGT